MKARIEIDMNNEAFQPDYEIELARILTQLARDLFHTTGRLRDANGNICGRFEIVDE